MISYDEWKVWQEDPITKAFMQTIEFSIEGLKEEAISAPDRDIAFYNYRVGAVQALRDILDFRVDKEGNIE